MSVSVESAPEWIASAKEVDWVRSLRSWVLFSGMDGSELVPFALPRPGKPVGQRLATNIELFLANYAMVRARNSLSARWAPNLPC
jgi:hypothetical protein